MVSGKEASHDISVKCYDTVYKIIHRGLKCTMKTKCYSVRSESPLEGIIIQESVRLRKRERET